MGDERIQFMTQIEQYLDSLPLSFTSRQDPPYSTAAPQEHLQSQMDNGMLRLEQSLCRLFVAIRRERNLLSPVSALPPEVLATIFSYGTLADILRTSWVSYAWRAAAISTPSLWTHFDWYRYRNPEFRALQLARCRTLALALDLGHYQMNAPPRRGLTTHPQNDTLPLDLISRAHSITRLVDLSCLEKVDLSMLESLHTRDLSLGYLADIPSIRLETPALKHLFLEASWWNLPNRSLHMVHLQTLHLRMGSNHATDPSRILKQVAALAQLQEFSVRFVSAPIGCIKDYLIELQENPSDSSEELEQDLSDYPEELEYNFSDRPALKRIYLLNTPSSFQRAFLSRFRLAQDTNIEISPFYPVNCQLRGELETNTLWIDQVSGVSLYDHGTCVTKITNPAKTAPKGSKYFLFPDQHFFADTGSDFSGFPEPIPLDDITSLTINRGAPLIAKHLDSFVHLTSLAFTVGRFSKFGNVGLSNTLNEGVVKNCRRLNELVMVYTEDSFPLEEKPVETVIAFLKAWQNEHHVVFGVLRISPHGSSQPWLARREVLVSMTNLFELQDVDLGLRAPVLPEPWQFGS